jgi:transcription termination/antitermination protein NusA
MNKLDQDTISLINLFESKTRSRVKKFFEFNEILVFIVEEGEGSKAVGKGGANVKLLNNLLKKKIKIIEFNRDPVKFIKGFIYPIVAEDIALEEGTVSIKASCAREKGILIGRESKNLNKLKEIVKIYFSEIGEIRIV